MKASWFVFVLILMVIVFPSSAMSKEQNTKTTTIKQKAKIDTKTEQPPELEKALSDFNQPLPEIYFEKTVHDFGQLAIKEKGECEFKFQNTGQAPLKIERITMTCGCRFYSISKRIYKLRC